MGECASRQRSEGLWHETDQFQFARNVGRGCKTYVLGYLAPEASCCLNYDLTLLEFGKQLTACLSLGNATLTVLIEVAEKLSTKNQFLRRFSHSIAQHELLIGRTRSIQETSAKSAIECNHRLDSRL